MKINDFIFRFPTKKIVSAGICRVRTFINSNQNIYVLISELEENPSTSVTNSIEDIVSLLQTQEKIPRQVQIIEHYSSDRFFSQEFDLVTISSNSIPTWEPITCSKVIKLLECSAYEFNDYKQNKQVMQEIQNALLGIPKIKQFEYIESPDISERRLEIAKNMHSMETIKDFLNTSPSERQLSVFLKEDMSLLAEVYAKPSEEYICFAEFPVGNGRVDFAVFTGRSRMDVYLIEIKGAQKSLRKKNHYGDFRAEIQEGRSQLIERKNWCEQNYIDYKRFVHLILDDIIQRNTRPYHAFLGPIYKLEVDAQKDVDFHYILIAGRTSEDLTDSKKRHQADAATNFHIQTETWDSWINKLIRK